MNWVMIIIIFNVCDHFRNESDLKFTDTKKIVERQYML